jgi:hypothetical protein
VASGCFFAAGTQEVGTTPQGAYNLNAYGEVLFLNAVHKHDS